MDKNTDDVTRADQGNQSDQSIDDSGSPKFGRLLIVLVIAVIFCGLLTWVMAEFFPNFPG